MQTYTHLGVSLVVSQIFFPEDNFSQILVVGASLVPDVPAASMFVLDKFRGRQPLKEQGKVFLIIQEIFHSLLVWLITGFWRPVFIGAYSHLILDWISHSDERFRKTDPSMIWPLPWKLRGVFEYREEHGKLYSPLEIRFTIFCVVVAAWLRWFFWQ
jgi:hypothetical protein